MIRKLIPYLVWKFIEPCGHETFSEYIESEANW